MGNFGCRKGTGVKLLCGAVIREFVCSQERVLEWKFCTAIMGKFWVPGKGSGVKILHCNHGIFFLVPRKKSGVKILHCNHGKIVGSRRVFWSENFALQSWEFFIFFLVPGKGSGMKIVHCNHGKIFGSRKMFWSENFALQSWEKKLVPGKGSGVKILHCNHGKVFGSRKGLWSENFALQSWEFFWFQEKVLGCKTWETGSIPVYICGDTWEHWSLTYSDLHVAMWGFSQVSMLGKPGQTEEIHQHLQKNMVHFWCTFKRVSKVHQQCTKSASWFFIQIT